MKKQHALTLLITLVFSIVFIVLLFGLGKNFSQKNKKWFQYSTSQEHNNNRENLANHNYPFNLMLSAEENAIFMTEGGDNQVFSLLYFALVENLRPDIDFFDQKGNVFPRLYGDLFKTKREDITLIRAIRDFQLFSTGRPVYLTWPRKGLEELSLEKINDLQVRVSAAIGQQGATSKQAFDRKFKTDSLEELERTAQAMVTKSIYNLQLRSGGLLSDQDFKYLGPWYLKPLGLVYRVTPIRYALVDALMEDGLSGDYFTLASSLRFKHKVDISPEDFKRYVLELIEEGYVKEQEQDSQKIQGLRSFSPLNGLEDKQYWEAYKRGYLETENAEHWERLAVDIFAEYARLEQDSWGRYSKQANSQLANISGNAEQKAERKAWLARLREYNEKAQTVRKEHQAYLKVTPNLLTDYAKELWQQGKILEANGHLRDASAETYWYVYPLIFGSEEFIKSAVRNPDDRAEYIQLAQENLDLAQRNKEIYYGFFPKRGKLENDTEVMRIAFLRESLNVLAGLEKESLASRRENTDLEKREEVRDLGKLYFQLLQEGELITLYSQLLIKQPNNLGLRLDYFSLVEKNNAGLALNILRQITNTYENFSGAGRKLPPKWSFFFSSGVLQYRMLSQSLKQSRQNQEAQLLFLAKDSQRDLQNYVNEAGAYQDDKRIRQRIVSAEKRLKRLEGTLAQLEARVENDSGNADGPVIRASNSLKSEELAPAASSRN